MVIKKQDKTLLITFKMHTPYAEFLLLVIFMFIRTYALSKRQIRA